ncbi:hypothetical protein POX_d05109 [Penicillium oxalicum]|uniref:Uncharacterized protein n=1 Tax=Penicillium oxalicum (strain 114-2 / CGMCC 5302) TaxID=933388 RepID=S7ZPU1_PENO1|nr:hypothetical protein POX_d05109 [Penicillium oxalicum]EPS32735.1 hypothetical protein PDE_07695 [Penicillium oxalicum 114-2]KAI2789615.1 hypothetical protein POX_d05109 [Penicillium oxalicum]
MTTFSGLKSTLESCASLSAPESCHDFYEFMAWAQEFSLYLTVKARARENEEYAFDEWKESDSLSLQKHQDQSLHLNA